MNNEYLVGKTILGYQIQELIGSGGFGKVYKGVKKVGKDEYYAAIKHISLPKDNEYNDMLNSMGRNYDAVDKYYEKILEDMINEINTLFYLSKKDNKNIVTYYDHDIVKYENPLRYDIFIRMEYLKPLNIYSNEGNMTIEDAINLGIDIARALDNCHKQGIIHRDVKDGNIFINEDGDFKLGDFGIARMLSDSNQTLSMKGTPIFMAPEVVLGKYYDKTVDIYSLGIVLYKLLNYNRIPFLPNYPEIYTSRDTDIAMNRRLSGERFDNPQNANDELGQVILKACEKQGKRYSSCEDLISDLIKVKHDMSEDKLSKLLFEVDDEKSKSDKHDDLEDNYILTQNEMDDTVLLGNSLGEYTNNVEYIKNDNTYEPCVDNSIDDTVILDCGNEADLSEPELIDDTVVISENIVEESTENLKNNEENKGKNTLLKTVTIATSLCLVLGFGYFHLKNKENIEKEKARIEQLKANLPKISSKLGRLPGTFSNIVTINNAAYLDTGGELGRYDKNLDKQFTILTNTDGEESPGSFNKYGDFIYYVDKNYKVKKYNTVTSKISDVYGIYANQIIIIDDYMYYNNYNLEDENEFYYLYKLNLKDGSNEKISNTSIGDFSINSTHMLYNEYHTGKICLMDLKTKEINTINITDHNFEYWTLYENCILYIGEEDRGLYRINLNGNDLDMSSKEKIQDNVDYFALEGEYLYFIEGSYYLDGSSKLFVKDLISNDIYHIADDVLNIGVDGSIMKYNSSDGYFYADVFSPERYIKIEK